MLIDPQDAYRSLVAAILFEGLTLLGDVAADILIQQVLFRLWLRDRCCSTAYVVGAIVCVLLHVGVLLVIRQQSYSGVNVTAPVNASVLLLF